MGVRLQNFWHGSRKGLVVCLPNRGPKKDDDRDARSIFLDWDKVGDSVVGARFLSSPLLNGQLRER